MSDPCPSSFDVVGCAKWNSWNSRRGTSKELISVLSFMSRDAEDKYVDYVHKFLSSSSPDEKESSMGSGFGMKVSTFKIGYELNLNGM